MLIIVGVVGMIVSKNCNRFLLFQMCVSIVVVSVITSYLVLGGDVMADMVNMCCSGVYSVSVRLL